MAGDWIKFRSSLFTHPKVVRMSSALKSDTLRTVGGLMSVWCLFDTHSTDGKLEGYTAEIIDDHLRWPGFCEQMKAIGWLEECSEFVSLPRFEVHNGQSAKRRAQDADRKREVRKSSASDADKMRTREEKRREEKNIKDKNTVIFPADIPEQLQSDFIAHRKAKKAPITQTALDGIGREANKAGITLKDALEMCCQRGWTGFKAEWVSNGSPKNESTDDFMRRMVLGAGA